MSNTSAGARSEFFRQSGWMALATIASGVFNMGSNIVVQRMESGQPNIYNTAMAALAIVSLPAVGLQASYAAQAAGAEGEKQKLDLAATMRGGLMALFLLWLAQAAWWVLRREEIIHDYKLTHPAMLWVLLLISLTTLLTPVPLGVLQGRQNFFWYGIAVLLNGAGRFLVLMAGIHLFKWSALGALTGVLAGSALVFALALQQTLDALRARGGTFAWGKWLRRLVPLCLGLGALTLVMQADALIVREKLLDRLTNNEADGFSAVRTIGLAMVFLIGGLTSVMYPKVARSFQKAEKTDVLTLTVLLTVAIGIGGATMATLFPELPLRLLSPARLIGSKELVPAYCWALVPLALANVLVWSLLARECYRAVPWLAAAALGDWFALQRFHDSLFTVIGVTAISGCVLVAICTLFLWLDRRRTQSEQRSPRESSAH